MLFKATMKMRLATNASKPNAETKRIGGWTESFYFEGDTIDALLQKFVFGNQAGGPSLCSKRASLLPIGAAVIGQRIQLLNPVGASQSLARNFAGSAALAADVPQMQLLCRAPAFTTPNVRQIKIKGIPDARVVEGEYSPSDDFRQKLLSYFAELSNWKFRGRDLSILNSRIFSIAADGRLLTEFPIVPAFAINDTLEIRNTVNALGLRISGRFRVSAVNAGGGDYTLAGWTAGLTAGGTVTMKRFIYPTIDGTRITISRITVGKVGRPFDQYVGRRSRRSRS